MGKFAESILASESGIVTSDDSKREDAFNTLVTFLMSFASRTGVRDRLNIFTTNYDRLIEAGASGYVGKACDAAELLRAVRDVSRGKKYLASAIAQGMALSAMSGNDASPFDALTPRELEVALLLNQGMRQEAIAKRLSLSAKTVNTHKSRLFEKLAIRDSIALARLVSQYGLVDPAHAVH